LVNSADAGTKRQSIFTFISASNTDP